jgi:hypothetical protein
MAIDKAQEIEVNPVMEATDFNGIVKEITRLGETKNAKYKDSPINILPTSYWLNQIVIKALRAEQSTNEANAEEELTDVIVYSIRTLIKIRGGSN